MRGAAVTDILSASKPKKAAAVFLGAILLGVMWRIRGDGSFGGFWGMLAAATAFVLYIFALCGRGNKARAEYFAFTALMCAVTNGGWGTLNSQITGTLNSSVEFSDGYLHFATVSPWSGVAIMLLLGVSWAPFLGAFLGIFFSSKKYKLSAFAEIIALYYVLLNVFKATLAHPLLKLINPQAVTLFSEGLTDRGILLSPWKAYLGNFSDMSFSKSIPGGRNYFTSVAVCAGALAALAVIVWFALRFKDGAASRFMLFTCSAFAIGITAADVFILIEYGGTNWPFPAVEGLAGWSFWECFTGFISGLLIMTAIVSQNSDRMTLASEVRLISSENLPQPVPMFIQLALAFLLPFGASVIVPLSEGAGELAEGSRLIVIIIGTLLYLAAGIYLIYRFMYKKGQSELFPEPFSRTAMFLLPGYFLVINIIYWFTGNAFALNPPLSPVNILMLISAVLFGLLFYTVFKNALIKEKTDAGVSE